MLQLSDGAGTCLFGDPRRPKTCIDFLGPSRPLRSTCPEALNYLTVLERETAEA